MNEAKAPETIVQELETAPWLKTIDGDLYLNTDWLRSSFASILRWGAKEGLRKEPMPSVATYYKNLLAVADQIEKT